MKQRNSGTRNSVAKMIYYNCKNKYEWTWCCFCPVHLHRNTLARNESKWNLVTSKCQTHAFTHRGFYNVCLRRMEWHLACACRCRRANMTTKNKTTIKLYLFASSKLLLMTCTFQRKRRSSTIRRVHLHTHHAMFIHLFSSLGFVANPTVEHSMREGSSTVWMFVPLENFADWRLWLSSKCRIVVCWRFLLDSFCSFSGFIKVESAQSWNSSCF